MLLEQADASRQGRYALSKLTSDQRATNFLRTDAITLATDGSMNAGWCGAASQATRYAMSSALSQGRRREGLACVGVCGLRIVRPSAVELRGWSRRMLLLRGSCRGRTR